MTTIMDVVKRSGISKSTVSRVINNHPSVSKEKRERVLQAMEELNFTPNVTARKMRGQVKTTVGVLIPNVTNPFFSYLIHAIERQASEQQLRTIIFQTNELKEKELEFLELLKQKQVDGVIFTSIENDVKVIEPYLEYGPLIFCNEYAESQQQIPIVRLNQVKAAYAGTAFLLEQGHRKMAYCTGGLFAGEGRDRDRNTGFREAMEEYDVPLNPQWIFVDRHTINDGREVMKQIAQMSDKPEAIFTGSDLVAAGIIAGAREHGIRIPEELAVIGFDDQPIAEITYPMLTTIKQPIEELGKQSAKLMAQLFTQGEIEKSLYEMDFQIIEREST